MRTTRHFFTRSPRNNARNSWRRSSNCSRRMAGTPPNVAVTEWNKHTTHGKNMNTNIIIETARKTLDGKMSFPEVVGQLLTAGVEYYQVDYVGLKKTFYSADGDMVVTPINYEGLPPVAAEFDMAALRAD